MADHGGTEAGAFQRMVERRAAAGRHAPLQALQRAAPDQRELAGIAAIEQADSVEALITAALRKMAK